jgi:hypothetical protein
MNQIDALKMKTQTVENELLQLTSQIVQCELKVKDAEESTGNTAADKQLQQTAATAANTLAMLYRMQTVREATLVGLHAELAALEAGGAA